MPTENQIAASENIERSGFPMVAVSAQGGGTGNQGLVNPAATPEANPTPTAPSAPTLGDSLGNLLLQQLQNPQGSGNLGNQEIPINVPPSGPNPLVVVGVLIVAILVIWYLTKKGG